MSDTLHIIIGGDIVPTKSNILYFENGDMEKVVSRDLRDILLQADFRIFNLETPLCNKEQPIEKEGPCFRAGTEAINGLKKLNPDLFTLANNHILDQGVQGLLDTIAVLDTNNIAHVGAGAMEEAQRAYYVTIKGVVIGIYGCVEHEFTVATTTTPGANPFEALDTPDMLREIKKKCDILIVLYHGGKEYYEYPSPELQKRCRKMVDCGADIVICQHSHCVGSYEYYNNGKILYGQGNFLFDHYVKAFEEYFQTGILVDIAFKQGIIQWKFIPVKRADGGVRLADEKETQSILAQLDNRSQKIMDVGFVERSYHEYAHKVAGRYIIRLSRFGYILSSIDNRLFGGKLFNRDIRKYLGRHHRLALLNCLQCEVHNEILREYLRPDMHGGKMWRK